MLHIEQDLPPKAAGGLGSKEGGGGYASNAGGGAGPPIIENWVTAGGALKLTGAGVLGAVGPPLALQKQQ